ncbi:FtsX-like permease family protein [Lacipirellula limnantheis]|uniref:Lipoprotein-releasing system transmembrane protein LolE n=1 Tax=Lacipirellula limnantheis TaxID=2528024 RepID=A0A517TS43_9BACT|nr:FtsX-like permease family protein [Lacipirellula limnantheis]QDT71192.1 Lipoprotein-releasing system transmembrane protein LolE [Lacipirellula limnantheis]
MLIPPLDRKMFRDLWHMRGLAAAISVVMGCGIALFILSRSMLHSLELTQQTYYDRYNFADVFASIKRAPDELINRISKIPGVAIAERRIVVPVNLSVPGLDEPASGRLISVPDVGRPRLDQLYLRRGRWLTPRSDDEALASEAFVDANQLEVGDTFSAVINGRMKELQIVGVVLSPEYIYEIKPGGIVPDNRHFGVFWMNEEALSLAFDMDGAFNDLAIKLMRGANVENVIQRVDYLIEPYGGLGAFDRRDQLSHQFVDNEIEQNRNMGLFAPSIFLGVSAFLINVVMSRTINSQREQIAALKAFGYSNLEVGWHYIKGVLLIAAIALAIGIPAGAWFGWLVTRMYARLFHFPVFLFRIYPSVLVAAAGVAASAAILGAIGSVSRAVRLPPAEAMRPEPPSGFGPTILERMGIGRFVPPIALMVVRQLERHPIKTGLSTLAISLAVAVLVIGNFFQDSIDYMMNAQFHWVQRFDVSVATTDPVSDRAMYELASMPGVMRCEPTRTVSARVRAGARDRRVGIRGIEPQSTLYGLVDMDGRETPLPPHGLLISKKLAEVLDVNVGDWVEMEVLTDKRPKRRVMIAATLKDFVGLAAYMDLEELRRIMLEGQVVNGVNLEVDPAYQDALYRELKETPAISTVMVKQHSIDSFNDTIAKNLGVMKRINLIFACIIAAGVVYNSARISLSERSRELATLRVIGFTRQEISSILLGELAIVTLLAIPVGLGLGTFFAWWMCTAFDQELFRFPMVVSNRTYAWASLVVIAASAVSGLLVRRSLDHLDLVAVLKSRE